VRDRWRGRPPEPASPLNHAPAPRFAAGPGGGSGNKTGTNRRRAKRIRFSRKKRVDSRSTPTTNAVGYRFAAPPFGGARRNGAHRAKGGTKRARIMRSSIRAGKAGAGKPFPAIDGSGWSLWFPHRQRRLARAIPARDRGFKAGTKAARIGDFAIRGGAAARRLHREEARPRSLARSAETLIARSVPARATIAMTK
jgi:hypothetical protein